MAGRPEARPGNAAANPMPLRALLLAAPALALAAGCLEPDAVESARVEYLVKSTFRPEEGGYAWVGVGGAIDGVLNPTLTATGADLLVLTVKHGCDESDVDPHNLYVAAGGPTLAQSADVRECGDVATIEVGMPAEGGRYGCDFHAATQAGLLRVV